MDAVLPARADAMSTLRRVLCVAAVVLAAEAPARLQQPARAVPVPAAGEAVEQSLNRGGFDEWYIELAASEYLEATIEPVGIAETDGWPAVSVIAPGEHILLESA